MRLQPTANLLRLTSADKAVREAGPVRGRGRFASPQATPCRSSKRTCGMCNAVHVLMSAVSVQVMVRNA